MVSLAYTPLTPAVPVGEEYQQWRGGALKGLEGPDTSSKVPGISNRRCGCLFGQPVFLYSNWRYLGSASDYHLI